jgi:hypothetical protein
MKNINLPKILFYANIIAIPLIISFGYGLYSATSENWAYVLARSIKNDAATVFLEKDNILKTRPAYFLRPARYDGSGVTVNKTHSDSETLVLVSGFFEDNNELRLIRRNGEIVARWIAEFSEIFPDTSHLKSPPTTDWNIEIHGALALSDGSVVFNFQIGGLVKLDRCGDLVWTLPLPAHHSVELAEGGGFWVPGLNFHDEDQISPFPPFRTPFREDTVMKISDDGVLNSEISVPKLFFDNDLESLLTSTGESFDLNNNWDNELVHLNKIAELKSDIADDFPLFEAGDLMLSIRQYNMVFVVDPVKNIIKWWKIGPWKRQHDPEFAPGGKIIVFNNNVYKTPFSAGTETSSLDLPRVSNVIEIDPVTGKHRVIYGNSRDQELLTVIRGKHELMPHGGLLITESQGGRVLETDRTGQIIWEYINRYDDNDVAILTEARVYPASYFGAVTDWACETNGNRLGN